MTTDTAPALPASSLLDLWFRRVAPFDRSATVLLAGVDGTAIDPPMLIEGINSIPDDNPVGTGIFLSVWPENRRPHIMHGVFVDEAAVLDLQIDPR
jgi:hypothetical protein